MNLRSRALLATSALLAGLVVPTTVGNAAADTVQNPAQDPAPAAPLERVLVQNLSLAWAGKDYQGGATATAMVPGIGNVTVICRRNSTMVQLRASNRTAETQMWMAKYETKRSEPVVAVKTVRMYRHATRGDTSGSGTGPVAHEGLNQFGTIENRSSGYLHGIVSQRPGRHLDAAGATLPPATSFSLNWYWDGFREGPRASSCRVTARFVTNVTDTAAAAASAVKASRTKVVKVGKKKRRVGRTAQMSMRRSSDLALNWHGDADAATSTTATASLAGAGLVSLTCETGRNSEATLSLVPLHPRASMYVEQVSGEGEIYDHVEESTYSYDPVTGSVGPVELPSNGMLRVYLSVNGQASSIIVSSYRKTNDLLRPELNVCEVATAPWID